jgi:plasmid stabilization system protein ParE
MAKGIIWSAEARADLRRIAKYLKETVGEEYAVRCTTSYLRVIAELLEYPTKGTITVRRKNTRRWKLDRHNYVLYSVLHDGIEIKNILPYSMNKKGF